MACMVFKILSIRSVDEGMDANRWLCLVSSHDGHLNGDRDLFSRGRGFQVPLSCSFLISLQK
jgi:hypothetical protein